MTNRPKLVWRSLPAASVVILFCLVVGFAWAQEPADNPQLPYLDSKKAAALLLNPARPTYPALARVNFLRGLVRLRLTVAPDGAVTSAHVLSGEPILATAALDFIKTCRYRPLVSTTGAIAFNFALRMGAMDLTPEQAEADFRRQVKPPQILESPAPATPSDASVRVRLLVNAEGKVIDWAILRGLPPQIKRALNTLERWRFRPAHWGALSVPWYLDVDIPVRKGAARASEGSAANR
jgi:TonB family protein